jgi:cytochrome c2
MLPSLKNASNKPKKFVSGCKVAFEGRNRDFEDRNIGGRRLSP